MEVLLHHVNKVAGNFSRNEIRRHLKIPAIFLNLNQENSSNLWTPQ